MRISVVIPAFNNARTIGETLDSVLKQTLAPTEIIVVDDGSSDDSAAIAESRRVKLIRRPNGGQSAARNTGIEAATGNWIALLDADDLWHPSKLERQVTAVSLKDDIGVVACDHYQLDEQGTVTLPSILKARADRYMKIHVTHLATDIALLTSMGLGLMTLGQMMFPSSLFFRRDLFLAAGGFDEAFKGVEDYELLLRLLARNDLLLVEKPLMGYRLHATNYSRNSEVMAKGLIQIGGSLSEHPNRYAAGAAEHFKPHLDQALLECAAYALKRGDQSAARSLLAPVGFERRGRRWWLLWLATRLPASLIPTALSLKRALMARR